MSWRDKDARASLVGTKVLAFKLYPDREGAALLGERNGTQVLYRFRVEADCCSHTWIEDVLEADALVGHTIASVENLMLPPNYQLHAPANGCKHTTLGYYEDVMRFYGLAITTERGRCVIDYRNSSNGYYGGDLDIRQVPATDTSSWEILLDLLEAP